ncbi:MULTISPECIES: SpoIIE family protein phosphatase [unclassified Streptomyces]|uniref:ATP-binding SpoIIE family protein phosphatase n=1 Tax=unclassified Streptomyces TaxID=2593676 RepID=UPI003406C583
MAITLRRDEWVVAVLVGYIALFSALVVEVSGNGLLRWALYATVAPLVAAALLPLRHTLMISVLSLAATACIYGVALPVISVGGRVVVITGVALAGVISVAVCRVRMHIMVARHRLSLLSEASEHLGRTLDVTQTAWELAEVTVPAFADYVSVDLFDAVLKGREPPTEPFTEPIALRHVAHRPDPPGRTDGELKAERNKKEEELWGVSLPARYLTACAPARASYVDTTDIERWLARDHTVQKDAYRMRSAIAVPLCAGGRALGTVTLLRHQPPRPFDTDDLALAADIGTRAAICLDNARRYARERDTALVLQRSLLPRHMPELAAAEMASRYIPASHSAGMGGDWFDVIPLSGARVALVVGDVVGYGLHASATMTRLRAAVRTLADIDLQPDELLTHLNDVVLRLSTESRPVHEAVGAPDTDDTAGEVGATCLYAVYDPIAGRCTLASAGHLPPAIVTPDHDAQIVDTPLGPSLGLGNLPFESVDVHVPEGSLLALYTDGLIREHHGDLESGLQELLQALSIPEPSLDGRCRAVLGALLNDQPADDVALLMARTRVLDADHVATWDVPTDPAAVADTRAHASDQLTAWGLEDAVFTTELIASELVTNAIRYAQSPIQLRLILEEHSLICEVSDGSTTTPHLRRARTYDEGGRGLFIVAQLAERWGTRHGRHGKTIWAELITGPAPVTLP